jgi:uncharacterized membrane protein
MTKTRLEAFSDGVFAIIITIMVLELKVPHGEHLRDLRPMLPVFTSYVLSFVFVGIYWSNHHHLLQAAQKVNGAILWANLHLLFWLSLIPWATAWMGENHFAQAPVALYGVDLLGCAIAYTILVRMLIHHHGSRAVLAQAVGSDFKGNLSLVAYVTAVAISSLAPRLSLALYVAVALMWLAPDRRIEKRIDRSEGA